MRNKVKSGLVFKGKTIYVINIIPILEKVNIKETIKKIKNYIIKKLFIK